MSGLLRLADAPWAIRPAFRAVIVALVLLGVGVATGQFDVGDAYFGVACAAVFVTGATTAFVSSW